MFVHRGAVVSAIVKKAKSTSFLCQLPVGWCLHPFYIALEYRSANAVKATAKP